MGRTLREARHRSGATLRGLAARAGTSHSALAAYESGAKVPRADTMLRVLAAAGCTIDVVPAGEANLAEREARGRELEELLRFTAHFPSERRGPLPDRRFGKVA